MGKGMVCFSFLFLLLTHSTAQHSSTPETLNSEKIKNQEEREQPNASEDSSHSMKERWDGKQIVLEDPSKTEERISSKLNTENNFVPSSSSNEDSSHENQINKIEIPIMTGDSSKENEKEKVISEFSTDTKQNSQDFVVPSMEQWREEILAKVQTISHTTAKEVEHETRPIATTINLDSRFNYASHECGAKVLAAHPESVDSGAVLRKGNDNYMLSPCSANKWLIIELCEEIAVDSIEIANYEFFSSIFHEFQVFGNNKITNAPEVTSDEWILLGNFSAKNIREIQSFAVEQPSWCKYILIKFLTHFGNEFYCPISLIKVHGSTLVEELKQQFEKDSQEIKELTDAIQNKAEGDSHSKPNANQNEPSKTSKMENDQSEWQSVLEQTSALAETFANLLSQSKDENLFDQLPVNDNLSHIQANFTPINFTNVNNSIFFNETLVLETDLKYLENKTEKKLNEIQPEIGQKQIVSVESQQQGKGQENIFKTLANRIKALEINQSLSTRYVEDVTTRYMNLFKEIKSFLEQIEKEHLKLSVAIKNAANQAETMQKQMESKDNEMQWYIKDLSNKFHKEVRSLKKQIEKQEMQRQRELWFFGFIVCGLITILFQYEKQKLRQMFGTTFNTATVAANTNELAIVKNKGTKIRKSTSMLYLGKRQPLESPL